MKITIPVLLFLCFCSFTLVAQDPYSIKGSVVDTSSATNLENTTISVLNAKDSMLVEVTRTLTNGSFSINNLRKGNFILLVTYPGYADYAEQFSLDSARQTYDFGKLNMVTKARVLAEVIVRGRPAIVIKGDTTEFSAEKFVIEPNSKVEDLLKQLPGIQVDKDGKITAHGQTVQKVLLDGEEFFGDDPTLVTKNIRGDMVDKVQLYDKKSDEATFTGIDDGVKIKTLNIVTKEGKKSGYFGKIDGGGATDDLYQGLAVFNVFETKRKFSAYGNIANSGQTGLGSADANRFGTASNSAIMLDGGGTAFLNSYDELEAGGKYNGRGLPLARTSGAHYDSKWNKDKESININYKIGSLNTEGSENRISQQLIPNITNSVFEGTFNNYTFRQKLDATYQTQLDSSSTLKITVDGTLRNTRNSSTAVTATTRDNTAFTGQNRNSSTESNSKNLNSSALWTKKFRKKSRTMSLNVTQTLSEGRVENFINSTNNLYTQNSVEIVDQYKPDDSKGFGLNTNVTYTEPISKTLFATLNYGVNISNSSSDKRSYNKSGTGQYDELDQEFSNNFDNKQFTNLAGAVFRYTKAKTNMSFGTRMTGVNYNRLDVNTGTKYNRSFLNWSPQMTYSYRPSTQKSISGTYAGTTNQPSMTQLQPLKANEDPLNVTLGNPDLKPSYNNRFSLTYSSYKILKSQDIYVSGSYSFISNQIVGSRSVDAAGKSTFQSVNLTNRSPSNFSVYSYISKQLKKSQLYIGLDLNLSGGTSFNFINNVLNTQRSLSYGGTLSLSKSKAKKYNFSLRITPSYNTSSQSLQKTFNDNPIKITSGASFTAYLPGKIEVTSSADYRYTEKTKDFDQVINPMIWDSSISKKFFKTQNLKFSLSGSNLLNQDRSFNRSANSQSNYTTIRRYFMGSLTWDFSKMGATQEKK